MRTPKMGGDRHFPQIWERLTLSPTTAEQCRPPTGIHEQTRLDLVRCPIGVLHLHHHLICSDTGLFHRVLTIHEGPGALCVPQQQVIESSPDDVVRKGWLK